MKHTLRSEGWYLRHNIVISTNNDDGNFIMYDMLLYQTVA